MFVIVGVPGVGKSTLASLLKSLGYSVIELKEYVEKNDEYLAYDAVRESLVIPPDICLSGIVVSTFIPECEVCCVLVEAPKEIVRERLKRRGYSEEKIEENLEAMEVLRLEAEEYCKHLIIIDGTDVSHSLKAVIEFIKTFEEECIKIR